MKVIITPIKLDEAMCIVMTKAMIKHIKALKYWRFYRVFFF